MQFSTYDLARIPVWVKFYNVSLEYWTIKMLSSMREYASKMVKDSMREHGQPNVSLEYWSIGLVSVIGVPLHVELK